MTIGSSAACSSLIAQADRAMARGDVRQAASLLEVAAQRGQDSTTLMRLAAVRRSVGDLAGAIAAARAGVELSPRNFLMCLLLGSLQEATGALHAAQRAYRAACAQAAPDLSFQPGMQRQLDWARRRAAALEQWHGNVLEWDPSEAVAGLSHEEERRMRGFRTNILENIAGGAADPPLFIVPGIKTKRYFEPSNFAGISDLERSTEAIRAEFVALADSNREGFSSRLSRLHAAHADGGQPGRWSMIPLIRNGVVVDEFASKCPRTMEAAARLDLPKLSLVSPSLYFSVLEPRSRIAPHIGITNARLISHLPLIIPDRCGFRVGGETRRWEQGRALVFDDMTTHEAWNDSDRIRVVLIADLWRPELTQAERSAVTDLMDCADVRSEDQPQ